MNKILKIILISSLFASSILASERTSIKLGTEDWAPFSFKDKKSHKISGLSTDIIRGTFKMMNVKISSIRIFPWIRTEKMAFQGKFDAVYTASINDKRKKYMYFPKEAIVSSKWVLFVKKANKNKLKFNGLSSLKNKTICLVRGYNYPKLFKKYIAKNSKLTVVARENLNIAKLINGRCDYMPAVLETTLYMAKNKPYLNKMNAYNKIFYFPKELSRTKFYLMFSKKTVKKSFVDKFSKTLQKFKTTTEYKNILKKYL